MNPFETLSFIVEHAENGSVAVLVTQDNVPIILTKEDEFSFSAYLCTSDGEVKHFRKEFNKTTFHRAILEFLDEVKEAIGKDVVELKLSNAAMFPECVPKREPRREGKKREKEEVNLEEKVRELKSLPSFYHLIPLVTDNGKLFSFVPEVGGTVEVDFVVKAPVKVDGTKTPVNLDAKSLYSVLSTVKLDPKLGNPFSTEGSFTFFTAIFVHQETKGKGKFMNVEMDKSVGRFLSLSSKGTVRTETMEFLSFPHKNNGLYVGFFVKGQEIVELQSVDIVATHKEGKFRVNDYVFSSFTLTSRDGSLKLEDYDRAMSGFVNLLLSKSNGREVLKDVIELHSMGPLDLPMVKGVSNNVISVVDPISFWYSKVYERSDEVKECVDCPFAEKVRKRDFLLSALRRKGYFASFLL
ncbi:MAG: hypothetical protein K1T65_05705 [Candidatus Aramenus sp.]|nr:hypothetical protein [Candidatus Aramenus sp.]